MEHYHKHVFFVDAGVTVAVGSEINALQRRFSFSEEMRKLLLIQAQMEYPEWQDTAFIHKEMSALHWYTLNGYDELWDIIERNEDCILSDYLFVFAEDERGNQYAEITKGKRKGHIVWLNLLCYDDIDSLEELIEERLEQRGVTALWSDDELIFNLVYTDNQMVEIKSNSLELFLC